MSGIYFFQGVRVSILIAEGDMKVRKGFSLLHRYIPCALIDLERSVLPFHFLIDFRLNIIVIVFCSDCKPHNVHIIISFIAAAEKIQFVFIDPAQPEDR